MQAPRDHASALEMVTAQLVDATHGFHVWSERYDRKANIFLTRRNRAVLLDFGIAR